MFWFESEALSKVSKSLVTYDMVIGKHNLVGIEIKMGFYIATAPCVPFYLNSSMDK